MEPIDISRQIKSRAYELGFDLAGIARASTPPHVDAFDDWESRGYAGSLGYLVRSKEKIRNPSSLLPGARSVLCCAVSYRPALEHWSLIGRNPVSCYAWGRDYHLVLKEKLEALAAAVRETVPGANTRCFVDSGPVLEKSFARQAGLGSIGKHTLLLNERWGSFLFLGEILTDADLAPDAPFEKDLCKACRKCMDACPTGALVSERVLDARKCVSYRTQREDPLPAGEDALNGMLWGCDLCQKACPYNEKAPPGREVAFNPKPEILGLTIERAASMPEGELRSLVRDTAMAGAKPGLLERNAEYSSK